MSSTKTASEIIPRKRGRPCLSDEERAKSRRASNLKYYLKFVPSVSDHCSDTHGGIETLKPVRSQHEKACKGMYFTKWYCSDTQS